MNKSPYDILGVSKDASSDEVKKAYRKKARENHPDLNPDDEHAAERMNEINEAYDRIMNPEKYRAADARKRAQQSPFTTTGYGNPHTGTSGGSGPYVWTTIDFDDFFNGGWNVHDAIHPEASVSDSQEVLRAISCINARAYQQAINVLTSIPENRHNARWHYLFAIANNGVGNTVAAHDNIRRARQMDPNNQDYLRAQTQFNRRAEVYQEQTKQHGFSSGVLDPNWLCCCICLGPSCCSYFSQMFLFC